MAVLTEPIFFKLDSVIPAIALPASHPRHLNSAGVRLFLPIISIKLDPAPSAADVRQGIQFGFFGEKTGALQAGSGKPAQVGGAGRVY